MKTPVPSIGRLLDGAQRRFMRSRAGSVLILVVALLVLMALIGTAYMTMAQFDRAAAVQHTFNTEVDMLLDGVINQVKGIVTGELFVNGQFRYANPAYNTVGTLANFDSLGLDAGTATSQANGAYTPNPGTWWISARVPDTYTFLSPTGVTINLGTWSFISGPINGSGLFDTPYWPPKPTPTTPPLQYSARNVLVPGASSVFVDGQYWPSWQNLSAGSQIPSGYLSGQVIAADADGDGIADSGLVKLLTLDGITYYAAVRIVDNCAAINASIATRPNPATALTPPGAGPYTAMPGDFSPANLDLEGMLISPATELYGGTGLLYNRFNKLNPQTPGMDEFGNIRSDFNFMPDTFNGINLSFHQQWSQLGRRLENPSYISGGGSGTNALKFQALSSSESMTMARDFILRDPSTANSNSSSSILEQSLPQTTFAPAPTTAYTPGNVTQWFYTNFNYFQGANSAAPPYSSGNITAPSQMPMRPLLVSRNQVSNFIPSKFTDKGNYAGNGYLFGDMVTYNGHRYVCINPNPAAPPIQPTLDNTPSWPDPNWAYEPWTSAPTKTDANTGTFQQLYAAYWGVMADHLSVAAGGGWAPQWDTGAGRMFRSPIRSASAAPGTQLTPQQVMYLRAALAAVNTMDLRDGDDDVTSRTITIPPSAQGGTALQATVFGAEKEPYITQVYARNDQQATNVFVGIEIYNPFPTAINVKNWQLVAYSRTSHTLTSIVTDLSTVLATATPVAGQIAGGQRIVLVSNTSPPPTSVMGVPTTNTFLVNGLDSKGMSNEVFLMRPRSASGSYSSAALQNNSFTESSSNLNSLVPVDCYDLTNLPPTAADAAHATEWHYARPNDPASGKSWHFVYAGPWNAAASSPSPTVAGTVYATATAMTPLPPMDVSKLGTPSTTVASPADFPGTPTPAKADMAYLDVPLQVANTNFGGPLKLSQPAAAAAAFFPYGGFARNGDLLQVTYIGSYIISQASANNPTGPSTIVEMNPITMDASMATANDTAPFTPLGTSAIAGENIGRFCPVDPNDAAGVNDYLLAPVGSTQNTSWRYQWTTRLFDYLTVLSPQDDYTPQYSPWRPEPSDPSYTSRFNYTPASANASLAPQAVGNTTPAVKNSLRTAAPPTYNTANATEETAAINGLVNINTAPWRVLAAVPWVPATDGQYQTKNAAIARAIVRFRDVDDGSGANPKHGHGPFRSIFELGDIAVGAPVNATIRNADGNTSAGNSPMQLAQYGDIVQVGQTTAGQLAVTGDFETQFLTLNRVSNLITTRSDSFTAYILIQGWRNAETNAPSLVVQRRAAILLDRSAVTPRNSSPTVINVPMD